MSYQGKKKNDIIAYLIALLISLGFCSLLFINSREDGIALRKSVSFFLYPFVAVFAGKLFESVIKTYMAGQLANTIGNLSYKLGFGTAVFLFFNLLPEAASINIASYGIPFLTVIYAVKSELLYYIRQYIIASAIVKSVLYLFVGIIARLMILAVWQGGIWRIGISISVADMFFWGFFIMSLSMILSLFELSNREYLAAAGKWFGKIKSNQFLFGCVLVFVLKDMPTAGNNYPQYFIYIGWGFLFAVLLVLLIILFNKIRTEVSFDPKGTLRKHVQEVLYNKESEVKDISRHIDDYISKGDLSNLLISIANAGKRSLIPTEKMGSIIKPMLCHKDIPAPLICLKSEQLLNEKRNAEIRRKIIEGVIAEINNYGRKSDEF
jgi:hypothetical protein